MSTRIGESSAIVEGRPMAIQVIWDNPEQTIIRYIYDGRWTWEDLARARDEVHRMLDTVDYRVGIIVDVQKSSMLPSGALTRARQMATATPKYHQNEGSTVIVGANTLIRSLFDMFRKIYTTLSGNIVIDFATSLDEARRILRNQGMGQPTQPFS
jgi:hypothetical protein